MVPDHRRAWGMNEGASQMCAAQQLEISFCNEEREVVTEQNVGVHVCAACGCVLRVWVCACVGGYVHMCMHLGGVLRACACVYTCVCAHVRVCMQVCLHVSAYLFLHVCACLCACVDTCVNMCVCVCVQRLDGAASGKKRLLPPAHFILETSETGSSPMHFYLFCVDKHPKWD